MPRESNNCISSASQSDSAYTLKTSFLEEREECQIKKRIHDLFKQITCVEEIAGPLLKLGKSAVRFARMVQTKVLVESENPNQYFVATKSGNLYIHVEKLGAGESKETMLFSKAGTVLSDEQAKKNDRKQIAISTTKYLDERNLREYQNELFLHEELNKIRKKAKADRELDPLSHVSLSKPAARLNRCGFALVGKPFNGGNVDNWIKIKLLFPKERDLADKVLICADFLKGIAQLHAVNVVHRDIKSDNILIETREHVVTKAALCDLGKGSHLDPGKRFTNTSLYSSIMPPGRNADRNQKALDIYSAGRTVYQIFAGIPLAQLNCADLKSHQRNALLCQIQDVANQLQRVETIETKEKLDDLEQQLIDWDISLGVPETWEKWYLIPFKVQTFICLTAGKPIS